VGDDPIYDVKGPTEYGMKAVWIDLGVQPGNPQADTVVSCLRDVPAAIRELARPRSAMA